MEATAGASVPWVRREPRPQDIDREKNRCVGFVLLIDVGHQETSAEGLSSLMRLDAKFTRIHTDQWNQGVNCCFQFSSFVSPSVI